MATDTASLLLLLNWMSPTFPIGSFAYSHGLEQAIADGHVTTQVDAQAWISDLLKSGSGWNDALLFAACYSLPHPLAEGDRRADEGQQAVNALALSLCTSAERYKETTDLGYNFNIAASVWTGHAQSDAPMAYPVAAGLACARMAVPKEQALTAYLQGFCAALVSVAVRLVPLGQTAGLWLLRDLAPLISTTMLRTQNATLDDLGSNCIAADIASMKHETLATRIFRT
jgi:urease accessory protein